VVPVGGAGGRDAVAHAVTGFARERQWLLPALHAVQHALGWLPEWALADVAAHLRVPASEAYGVATHYPEFRLAPRGRHHVRVCTGVSCALLGGRALLDEVGRRHAVSPGVLGAERDLTLEEADCFFACSMAPLVEVDGACHGRVQREDVAGIQAWFRRAEAGDHEPVGPAGGGPTAPRGPESSREVSGAKTGAAGADPPDDRPASRYLAALVERARSRARSPLRLLVQTGTCGRSVGAGATLVALRDAVAARRLDAAVVESGCNGMCHAAPVVEIGGDHEPRRVIARATAADAGRLVEALAPNRGSTAPSDGTHRFEGIVFGQAGWHGLAPAAEHPFWAGQERRLLARAGVVDPTDLFDAVLAGAYGALARALDGSPEAVIEAVKASGLQGRGGAFFPTALKWEACRKAPGEPKYLVMNGEEGEPGIFKDRHLMEGDPHQVLEGALIAAYAAGATRIILYVHGEADLSAARLARAVADAREAGLVGDRLLGRDVACHVEIRRGAGGFVLGEETALLESIEGRRAQPRTRPPFPVESGLWGRPTVINNVETLSAIPHVLGLGPEGFAALGTGKAPGTKVFGLSGALRRPGVVETRNGVSLHRLLQEIGGGPAGGERFLGAVVGGPSGAIVPAALFDTPMEPRGTVSPGTGGIVAVPEGASVADIVKTLVGFNARESCGKCTPCREGLPRLLEMLEAAGAGPGPGPRLRDLAEAIQLASLCGLGQAAPIALLRGLEVFGESTFRRAR
jgi:NADH-quinone oxidoreductase subunit F